MNNDLDSSLYKYDLYIESWNETMLGLKMDFENPYALSNGKSFDSAALIIRNLSYFKS